MVFIVSQLRSAPESKPIGDHSLGRAGGKDQKLINATQYIPKNAQNYPEFIMGAQTQCSKLVGTQSRLSLGLLGVIFVNLFVYLC